MTKPRSTYIIISAAVALVLILALAYRVYFNRYLADTIYGTKTADITKQVDLNGDGINEVVVLSQYQKEGKDNFVLNYEDPNNHSKKELSGFESGADFCPDPFPQVNSSLKIICISGFVGAHSQNIQLFTIADNKIEPITIVTENDIVTNVASDVPDYGFEDINHDGNLAFYVDNRNYDLDPTLDSWRLYYYFIDDEFVFDHKVPLSGGIDSLNQQGKIN